MQQNRVNYVIISWAYNTVVSTLTYNSRPQKPLAEWLGPEIGSLRLWVQFLVSGQLAEKAS
jgi:hypothetical protein